MTHIRRYETTGRPVFITDVVHRRIPYLKNLVGQVAPQALPDAYETTKFLSRSDQPIISRPATEINPDTFNPTVYPLTVQHLNL